MIGFTASAAGALARLRAASSDSASDGSRNAGEARCSSSVSRLFIVTVTSAIRRQVDQDADTAGVEHGLLLDARLADQDEHVRRGLGARFEPFNALSNYGDPLD